MKQDVHSHNWSKSTRDGRPITWSEAAEDSFSQLDTEGVSVVRQVLQNPPAPTALEALIGRGVRIDCKREIIEATDPLVIGDVTRLAVTVTGGVRPGTVHVKSVEVLSPDTPLPVPLSRRTRSGTALAVRIAGPARSHLRDEWAIQLRGFPEDDNPPSAEAQHQLVIGFLRASIQMRLRDVARPAWRPIDWLLSTSARTSGLITGIVGAQAIYIVGHQGLGALVTDVWEPCAVAGASLYALACWLRRVRGIAVEPSGRRAADE
ncbi:hypothetical protein [Streptomyces sp. NPDC001089]